MLNNLESEQFDVVAAFLYGELEEEIYMTMPKGYTKYLHKKGITKYSEKDNCLKLQKSIYGLVQAARQWWKRFKTVLENIGFKACQSDCCLFVRTEKDNKLTIILLYVDDGVVFGLRETINEVLNAIAKEFEIKRMGQMKKYLGFELEILKNSKELFITQPKSISKIKENFGSLLTGREAKIPAAPCTNVLRPIKGDELVSEEEQKQFRSGVGMLLFLIKHSRPDIANPVRELSKVLDGASPLHFKYMIRVMKYVMETKDYGLHIKPNFINNVFKLVGKADSDFCGDRETRISVYGYVLYFCDAPISWRSKSGKSVTLSSTEAEYFALSELAKEILFVKQILEHMRIQVEYPMIIHTDNIGAIYLSNNYTTSQRTRHIDTRCHFV